MNVFVTGATGYIGAVIVEKLRDGGHAVTGLARSDDARCRLESLGVRVRSGDLEVPELLAAAAREADGVIHAGLVRGPETGAIDRRAVEAMLDSLAGSGKPFVYTSGSAVIGSTGERAAGEWFPLNSIPLVQWRPAVERLVIDAAERQVRGVVIRPVTVYGRQGGIAARWRRGELPQARRRGKSLELGPRGRSGRALRAGPGTRRRRPALSGRERDQPKGNRDRPRLHRHRNSFRS